jgi:hypothetical protein
MPWVVEGVQPGILNSQKQYPAESFRWPTRDARVPLKQSNGVSCLCFGAQNSTPIDSERTVATLPGDRGAWVKTKCLNRAEFVVVGWSDPRGRAAGSALCCLATTTPTIASFTQGVWEPGCPSRRSRCCMSV